MKYLIVQLIIIALLLFVAKCDADSFENTFGGLTFHLDNSNGVGNKYSNKIGDGQLIYTGLLGLGYIHGHNNYQGFIGQNSIGEFIYGGTYSYLIDFSVIDAGPIVGFYQQNDDKFYEKDITPFSLGYGVVPIVGIELTAKVIKFRDKYIKLNTVITPILINETIGLGVEL